MSKSRIVLIPIVLFGVAGLAPIALAQIYNISWYTLDGGGGQSANGGYELIGTIGQSDAGFASGNGYELTGGFWIEMSSCTCPGDVNRDGVRNGDDIQWFVDCVLGISGCNCADTDGTGAVTIEDVPTFVGNIFIDGDC